MDRQLPALDRSVGRLPPHGLPQTLPSEAKSGPLDHRHAARPAPPAVQRNGTELQHRRGEQCHPAAEG